MKQTVELRNPRTRNNSPEIKYYIKTYKQFILVGSIVILKLIINYFLSKETRSEYEKRKLFNSL